MSDARAYTRALKSYDTDLFASRTRDGVLAVFRKHTRYEYFGYVDELGGNLFYPIDGKQLIFPLTDNWMMSGNPRSWGIDIVVDKIRQGDARANEALFDEMDAHNERIELSEKRSMNNEIESFWKHERRRFAKATDDVLTHSLSKDEPKRRLKDRSIK